jgi:hypothetical protein
MDAISALRVWPPLICIGGREKDNSAMHEILQEVSRDGMFVVVKGGQKSVVICAVNDGKLC